MPTPPRAFSPAAATAAAVGKAGGASTSASWPRSAAVGSSSSASSVVVTATPVVSKGKCLYKVFFYPVSTCTFYNLQQFVSHDSKMCRLCSWGVCLIFCCVVRERYCSVPIVRVSQDSRVFMREEVFHFFRLFCLLSMGCFRGTSRNNLPLLRAS